MTNLKTKTVNNHHGLPCPACGNTRPDKHCHTSEEQGAAIKAKGGFDWMQELTIR